MDSLKTIFDTTQAITKLTNTCPECDFPWKLLFILIFIIILSLIFRKGITNILYRLTNFKLKSDRKTGKLNISMGMDSSDSTNTPNHLSIIPHTSSIMKSGEKKKILWTLYSTQKDLFKDDDSKRFTLALLPQSVQDAHALYWEGLISLDGQRYFLTNIGLEFCKKHEAELRTEPYTYFR